MINLKIGKIYIISTFHNERIKYIGNNKNIYLFEWINPLSQRIIIRRIFNENDTYHEIDSDNETDNEFIDDPYEN
jgi:hypothetical protein